MNVTAFASPPSSSSRYVVSPSVSRRSAPKTKPGDEGGDEAAAAERRGEPVGERAVATGTTAARRLRSGRGVAATRDDQRAGDAGDRAEEHAVADRLDHEHERAVRLAVPASASAIASAMNSSGTQMPSLSPISTFRPCRMREGSARR